MSTEYELGSDYMAHESGSRLSIGPIENKGSTDEFHSLGESMDEDDLRKLIVKLIHCCSYIAEDPEEILKRFNVKYEQDR